MAAVEYKIPAERTEKTVDEKCNTTKYQQNIELADYTEELFIPLLTPLPPGTCTAVYSGLVSHHQPTRFKVIKSL